MLDTRPRVHPVPSSDPKVLIHLGPSEGGTAAALPADEDASPRSRLPRALDICVATARYPFAFADRT